MGIKLKRSAVASKVPVVADLELGELAVNTFDGKLYLKKSVSGADSIVEVGPVTSVAGRTGAVVLAIGDVASLQSALDGKAASSHGHAISDVANLQASLDAKAGTASPAFTGTPTAPSASRYTSTSQIATTEQVYDTVTNVLENARTATAYTLTSSDRGKMVTLGNASAITLTVPAAVFTAGDRVDILQYGAGQVTVAAGSGLTLRSSGSKLKLAGQYSGATLWFKSPTEAILIGDIAA